MAKSARKRSKAKRSRRKRPRRAPPSRAVETALAGVAHDIRTPLTGIMAMADLLSSSELKPREREWALAIKSGAEHLAALATLIVDAARAEAVGLVLRAEPFAPRALAEAVGEAMTARAGNRNLAATVAIADTLPGLVTGDSLRLRAALENLADNAVKFTARGTVGFEASAEAAPRGRVKLIFTFTDSGIGMSAAEIAQLFKPFAQASRAVARRYGGAGLGLTYVRRIARALGGDLAVDSRKGKGSTFRLSVVVSPVRSGAAAQPGQSAPARPLSLLGVEDNPYGRVVLHTILRELGHRADFAGTAEAAVAAVRAQRYDAVLMDVTLGAVDGLEATRRIRALPGAAGRTPVIGVSGRDAEGDRAAARAAGMAAYVTKPLSPRQLADALAAVTNEIGRDEARPTASDRSKSQPRKARLSRRRSLAG